MEPFQNNNQTSLFRVDQHVFSFQQFQLGKKICDLVALAGGHQVEVVLQELSLAGPVLALSGGDAYKRRKIQGQNIQN